MNEQQTNCSGSSGYFLATNMESIDLSDLLKVLHKMEKSALFYADNHKRFEQRERDKFLILNRLFGDKFDFPSLLG